MAVGTSVAWSVFAGRAETLGASVLQSASASAAAALLPKRLVCTRSARERFPAAVARATSEADDVVAAADLAVLETGSVLLNEPADDRGRCFLAEHLWLLVSEAALVDSLDAALTRIGALIRDGAGHPLLMSGPSRTADIERILTIGVHGPRALTIVVVGST